MNKIVYTLASSPESDPAAERFELLYFFPDPEGERKKYLMIWDQKSQADAFVRNFNDGQTFVRPITLDGVDYAQCPLGRFMLQRAAIEGKQFGFGIDLDPNTGACKRFTLLFSIEVDM